MDQLAMCRQTRSKGTHFASTSALTGASLASIIVTEQKRDLKVPITMCTVPSRCIISPPAVVQPQLEFR